MALSVEVEQEKDCRWLSEVLELTGVLAYGRTRAGAVTGAQVLALRVSASSIASRCLSGRSAAAGLLGGGMIV